MPDQSSLAEDDLIDRFIEFNPKRPGLDRAQIRNVGIEVWALVGYYQGEADRDIKEVAHRQKGLGFDEAFADFQDASRRASPSGEPNKDLLTIILCAVGQAFFDHVPAIQRFLPFVNLEIVPEGRRWETRLRSMCAEPLLGGPAYYSRTPVKLTIEGQANTFAWAPHATERLCQRFFPSWRRYSGLGDAFAVLSHDAGWLEPASLRGGQPAAALYLPPDLYPCVLPVREAIHEEWIQLVHLPDQSGAGDGATARIGVLAGYLPVIEQSGLWKATTFIPPGWAKTPERQALIRARLPRVEFQRMKAKIDGPRSYLYGMWR